MRKEVSYKSIKQRNKAVSNTSRQHESCEKGRNAAGLDGRKDARLEASIERKRKVNIKRGRTHCKESKQ